MFLNMAKFVLKPARILQTRLVTSKTDEAFELDFIQLLLKLKPETEREKLLLANLRKGGFIGKTQNPRDPKAKNIFWLFNQDRTGNIDYVLKKDPSFPFRVLEAYRVEEAVYDVKISENQMPEKVA